MFRNESSANCANNKVFVFVFSVRVPRKRPLQQLRIVLSPLDVSCLRATLRASISIRSTPLSSKTSSSSLASRLPKGLSSSGFSGKNSCSKINDRIFNDAQLGRQGDLRGEQVRRGLAWRVNVAQVRPKKALIDDCDIACIRFRAQAC